MRILSILLRQHISQTIVWHTLYVCLQTYSRAFQLNQIYLLVSHLDLIKNYVKPEKLSYRLPGRTAFAALELGLKGMIDNGQISEHDKFIGQQIATILSGGDTDMLNEVDEDHILKLESNSIQTLFKQPKSQERIEKLLETGKIIRN